MAGVRQAAADAVRLLADTRAALISELEQKNLDLELAFRELQTTQAQLVQSAKMASLGELVSGVAHEINNPLAFVLAHLDTVRRSLQEVDANTQVGSLAVAQPHWDRAQKRLHEIGSGLQRISQLVLKLRTFSRLDEGEQKLVSMRENVESVIMIFGHRLKDKIDVVTHFGDPDLVDCYPGLLNQALMNLISNAIDATEGRGILTISTGAEGDSYVITIKDTGRGVPEGIRDRIFEPFFTTKPVGVGTGLGLSITYSIVKKHGGELTLHHLREGGTSAVVRFPLTKP
jgi:two-component system NtrC family sensor kinase